MTKIHRAALLLATIILFGCNTDNKSATPAPAKHPLGSEDQFRVSDSDRCPVCAMKIKQHAKFSAAISLNNGDTHYFCGTGCMMKSWLKPDIFLGVSKSHLKKAVVKDYFKGAPLDALSAHWVAGSDIVGPMGPALVPLRTKEDLEAFQKRHGGSHVFSLRGLTPEQFQKITGKTLPSSP